MICIGCGHDLDDLELANSGRTECRGCQLRLASEEGEDGHLLTFVDDFDVDEYLGG
jgi:hypothetical protein